MSKKKEDFILKEDAERIYSMFPGIDKNYIKNRLVEYLEIDGGIDKLTDELLEMNGKYPKEGKAKNFSTTTTLVKSKKNENVPEWIKKNVEVICSTFKQIDKDFVTKRLLENSEVENYVDIFMNELIEADGNYPKEVKEKKPSLPPDIKNFTPKVSEEYRRWSCNFLSHHYAIIPLDVVIKECKKYNFHLYPTVVSLEKELVYEELNIKFQNSKVLYLPFPREVKLLKEEYDEFFRKEGEEALREIEKRKKREKARKKDLIPCPNPKCGVKRLAEDIVSCSKGCLICTICLCNHIKNNLDNSNTTINCLFIEENDCTSEYKQNIIEKALMEDNELKERFNRLKAHQLMIQMKKNVPDVRIVECFFCSFFCVVDDPNYTVLDCPVSNCKKSSCLKCRRAAHPGVTCKPNNNQETARRYCHYCGTWLKREEGTGAFILMCPNEKCQRKWCGFCLNKPHGSVMCQAAEGFLIEQLKNKLEQLTDRNCPSCGREPPEYLRYKMINMVECNRGDVIVRYCRKCHKIISNDVIDVMSHFNNSKKGCKENSTLQDLQEDVNNFLKEAELLKTMWLINHGFNDNGKVKINENFFNFKSYLRQR